MMGTSTFSAWISTLPLMINNLPVRISVLKRSCVAFQTPTLLVPVSASSDINMTPLAVPGHRSISFYWCKRRQSHNAVAVALSVLVRLTCQGTPTYFLHFVNFKMLDSE